MFCVIKADIRQQSLDTKRNVCVIMIVFLANYKQDDKKNANLWNNIHNGYNILLE